MTYKSKRNRILLVCMTAIIMSCIFITIAIIALKQAPQPQPVTIDTRHQPTLGRTDAAVHIVVFEDLKCPGCAYFNRTLFAKIEKKYIQSGVVRYSMVTLAFLPHSHKAANAALCLYEQNQSYFFHFINYIYDHQPDERKDWATIPRLLNFATQALPTFNKSALNRLSHCILLGNNDQRIKQNMELAKKAMHGHVSTPTLFVNGILLKQPVTERQLITMIEKYR